MKKPNVYSFQRWNFYLFCLLLIFLSSFVTLMFVLFFSPQGKSSDSSTHQLPAFLPSLSHFPASGKALRDDTRDIVSPSPDIITHGPRSKKDIALTFDADMTPFMRSQLLTGTVKSYYDDNLISILNQTQTPATLFLTGMWIQLYPDVTRQLAQNPLFELGNHSYSHPSFDGYCYGLGEIPDNQDLEQVETTKEFLREYGGIEDHYFRFPGGCSSQTDVDIITKEARLQIIGWDVVGDDGFNEDVNAIVSNVVGHVQNGSIIVMHMNGAPNDPKTHEALPIIIQALKDKGYQFVKVSELLNS